MGKTPDRIPGPAIEEELQFETDLYTEDPDIVGAVRWVQGSGLKARDDEGVFSLRATGTAAFDNIVLTNEGTIVYVDDGSVVTI